MERIRGEGTSSDEAADGHIILGDLILDKQWDVATTRVWTNEGREDLRRRYRDGRLPLHNACWDGAPLQLVEAMLCQYPESVKVTDDDGQLPLHFACAGLHISPHVVSLLLGAYPEGAAISDCRDLGDLPLHTAALFKAPSKVFVMLMNAYPEGAATRNRCGRLPVHLLAEESFPGKEEDVDKVEVLLRPLLDDEEACLVSDSRLGETPLHIGARFDVLSLHTCLRIRRCPVEVIATVANRHPEQLRELDENGSLPLHIAAANPNLNGAKDGLENLPVKWSISLPLHIAAANPNLNGAKDGQENLIVKWSRLYPEATAASDAEGRFPLILAIESGKKWQEGVEAIADAALWVIMIRDEATGLYPFMLAATVDNSCLTTVYSLLRCGPELKRYVLD